MTFPSSTNVACGSLLSRSASLAAAAPRGIGGERLFRMAVLVLAVLALVFGGCSRGKYRLAADAEAYAIIEEAAYRASESLDPAGMMASFSVDPDPRSRMHDPFCPDCPPMPPDDPAAHRLMQCVDGKRGWPHWDRNGHTPLIDSPYWMMYLKRDEEGRVAIDADSAVRLALIHSREYQAALETLYLSALDVSVERFRFDSQFFGGYRTNYEALGPLRGAGGSRSILTAATSPGGILMRRTFTTGADLVVGMANSLVWQFSGPDTHATTTVLDFAFVQPLLRAAGRDVVMENLTQSERQLLQNVRQMERYRRGFYVEVVAGRGAGPGPSRGGSVAGSGASGRVGGAGGFLGLVQDQQTIRNQESNIASLRGSLAQLEAFFEAGRIDFFQVELARQTLFEQQSRLLSSRSNYESALDQYKIQLGLPPQLEIHIDDQIVRPFNLIDSGVVDQRNRLTALQRQVGAIVIEALPEELLLAGVEDGGDIDPLAPPPPPPLEWSAELADALRQLKPKLVAAEQIRRQLVATALPKAREDIETLQQALPDRREDLHRLGRRLTARLGEESAEELQDLGAVAEWVREPMAADIRRLEEMPGQLVEVLTSLVRRFERHEARLKDLQETIDRLLTEGPTLPADELLARLRDDVFASVPDALTELSADTLELTLVQARARTETVRLVPIQVDPATALEIARENRPDWMNARTELVDAWRSIEPVADQLEGNLDLVFEGDMSNRGNNPAKLDARTGRLRVGLQFDAPLTRLIERNRYREVLISYQRAKRRYYTFEDVVAQGLRDIIRTIELGQLNFELRRAAVHVAISQVELTQLRLQQPPRPGQDQSFGATTARDLVDALSRLLSAQNDFLSVWINYQVLRRVLDLDLGTMQLDEEGLWIDPGPMLLSANGEAADGRGLPEAALREAAAGAAAAPPIDPLPAPAPLPPPLPLELLPPGAADP